MELAVWDTYLQRDNGTIMHFDILAPEHITDKNIIHQFGEDYLKSKYFTTKGISLSKCRFCHITRGSTEMIQDIENKGYSIIEMENCK
ncbi:MULTISPECIES: DUF2024 family protein [Aquimarina]|uniref:DUF2024 family protein n=1 Tax=Aquimarina TaxID=290174 RepID=UPI000CDEB02B|nr:MULTISPECIES: DUF2024 family protein [Aquimarina]